MNAEAPRQSKVRGTSMDAAQKKKITPTDDPARHAIRAFILLKKGRELFVLLKRTDVRNLRVSRVPCHSSLPMGLPTALYCFWWLRLQFNAKAMKKRYNWLQRSTYYFQYRVFVLVLCTKYSVLRM